MTWEGWNDTMREGWNGVTREAGMTVVGSEMAAVGGGITVNKVGVMQPPNGVYITQPVLLMVIYFLSSPSSGEGLLQKHMFNKH